MSSLSNFGIIHTVISLAALGAGIVAFANHRAITPASKAGQVYIYMTLLTCFSGFFIFAHGSFGKPHALGVITLVVLAVAFAARWTSLFGRAAAAVETVAYSLTFFFHMIPAITETSTRLPAGAPLLDSPDAPALRIAAGLLFLVFLAGAVLQVRWLRTRAS